MRLEVLSHLPTFLSVSIHASVKDATNVTLVSNERSDVSIHASVKDATENQDLWEKIFMVSIHASVKDATKSASILLPM